MKTVLMTNGKDTTEVRVEHVKIFENIGYKVTKKPKETNEVVEEKKIATESELVALKKEGQLKLLEEYGIDATNLTNQILRVEAIMEYQKNN